VKPFRVLIFITGVFTILFAVSALFPENGIHIAGDIRLKFASPDQIIGRDTVYYADISGLLSDYSLPPESIVEEEEEDQAQESLPVPEPEAIVVANTDSMRAKTYPLLFPDRKPNLLFPFYLQLDKAARGEGSLRIIHYGDSQIENDRMTSLLRYKLQKAFGGYGCGLVSAVPLYSGNPAFAENWDGDWERFTIFGSRDPSVKHNAYGIMGAFTALPDHPVGEWSKLEFSFPDGKRASRFDRVKLYLHSYADSSAVSYSVNDSISDTLRISGGGFQVLSFVPGVKAEKLDLSFSLPAGGRVYGLSFESRKGVIVDNVAMRGSSGLIFSKMDSTLLKNMYRDMKVKLLILQFGGNVIPYIEDPNFYKRAFKREIRYLKKVCPDIPFIVIGPSDMSEKVDGHFVTTSMVEPVRNALKEAALESGCAFWDMYEAMGGHNSMPSFVLADPPLAVSDYVHFTPRGANLMSELFFNSLMEDYSRYLGTVQRND